MANTTAPSVKKYYDYAQQQVDEQALLDKFNAATTAQFNLQREQNRQAENQFYNQMYNTQQTAMDTIRQSNAAAVSTGASRGVQAAQELSALLGLQQESVASATELAQANRQTAQEETAAVLENVLNAYQQAEQQRQNILSSAIQAESVEVESEANKLSAESNNLSTLWTAYLQAQANGDSAGAAKAWAEIQKINPNIPNLNTNNSSSNTQTSINPNIQAIANYGVTITEQELKDMGYDPTAALDENTIKKIAASQGANIPVTESGIQYDGSLKFTTSDLNEKNVQNVYNVLKTQGYSYSKQQIINLNDVADYDLINQTDFDSDSQSGEAAKYIQAIKNEISAGTIPVGRILQLNYGKSSDNHFAVYLGDGRFARVNIDKSNPNAFYSKTYIPKGYTRRWESFEKSKQASGKQYDFNVKKA